MSIHSEAVLSLVLLGEGGETAIPLDKEKVTFGRDVTNDVALPDASVSRHHAELCRTQGGLQLRDLDSRNGVRVNGVPRMSAHLVAGDSFEVGKYRFRLRAGGSNLKRIRQTPVIHDVAKINQTVTQRASLPELKHERQLATVYHACFWLTECTDREQLVRRISTLLHESLGVDETQFYSVERELEFRMGKGKKPEVKFATFLAERFQLLAEASVLDGSSIRHHQRGVGAFNYLIGPLRRPGSPLAPADFLVLIKPAEWEPFTNEDRVLVQAICQLWARESEKLVVTSALREDIRILRTAKTVGSGLLGESAALSRLRQQLRKAASTKATILLDGETGSGKEVVAQFIHDTSPRATGPFIKVNCAAIPDGLIESELFGHRKGAFTDAKEGRKGKFLQANGGTLFLDEIGEMPLLVQSKVLRVLESGEMEPLGSESPQNVDVRIIAATHRNLAEMVERKEFRQDLFFRLNVFNVRVPPLRDHVEDIPQLARHFLESFCRENGLADMSLDSAVFPLLQEHPWPGNVRELRNVIQRCAIVATDSVVRVDDVRDVM
jgi:hypothetical protein